MKIQHRALAIKYKNTSGFLYDKPVDLSNPSLYSASHQEWELNWTLSAQPVPINHLYLCTKKGRLQKHEFNSFPKVWYGRAGGEKTIKTSTSPPCQAHFHHQQTHTYIRIGLVFTVYLRHCLGFHLGNRSVSTYWQPVWCVLSIMSAHCGGDCSDFKGSELIWFAVIDASP